MSTEILHLSDPSNGWIEITFAQGADVYTFAASHTPNDCLADLAAATALLVAGSAKERVEFSLEPGFLVGRLVRDGETVRIMLTEPKETMPVFDATFSLHAFAKELESELLRIRPLYSTRDGWNWPFPERDVANLGW